MQRSKSAFTRTFNALWRCVADLGTERNETMPQNPPIVAGTRIGHVHLKVADIERALGFYCGVLGFELMQRYGADAAFISAGGYHHHIGLNTWESKGGHPPAPGTTGLFHTAILYPTRAALADALHRVTSAGIPLDGASDHGVSQASRSERSTSAAWYARKCRASGRISSCRSRSGASRSGITLSR